MIPAISPTPAQETAVAKKAWEVEDSGRRRARQRVLEADRGSARIATFNACCLLLEALDPQDRDVVVRRLRAYYSTPEPPPDADA